MGALSRGKRKSADLPRRFSVRRALMICGVDPKLLYYPRHRSGRFGSFAARWEDRLEDLRDLAKAAHRLTVKRLRPDLPGNDASRQLNEAWRRLRIWFARRGVQL